MGQSGSTTSVHIILCTEMVCTEMEVYRTGPTPMIIITVGGSVTIKYIWCTFVSIDSFSWLWLNVKCLSRDKAGGYGIQAVGGSLVKAIHGDYYNVVGFPANMFARRLTKHLQDGLI